MMNTVLVMGSVLLALASHRAEASSNVYLDSNVKSSSTVVQVQSAFVGARDSTSAQIPMGSLVFNPGAAPLLTLIGSSMPSALAPGQLFQTDSSHQTTVNHDWITSLGTFGCTDNGDGTATISGSFSVNVDGHGCSGLPSGMYCMFETIGDDDSEGTTDIASGGSFSTNWTLESGFTVYVGLGDDMSSGINYTNVKAGDFSCARRR